MLYVSCYASLVGVFFAWVAFKIITHYCGGVNDSSSIDSTLLQALNLFIFSLSTLHYQSQSGAALMKTLTQQKQILEDKFKKHLMSSCQVPNRMIHYPLTPV